MYDLDCALLDIKELCKPSHSSNSQKTLYQMCGWRINRNMEDFTREVVPSLHL